MQETSEAMARFGSHFSFPLLLIPKLPGIRGPNASANGRKAWSLCRDGSDGSAGGADDDDDVLPRHTKASAMNAPAIFKHQQQQQKCALSPQ